MTSVKSLRSCEMIMKIQPTTNKPTINKSNKSKASNGSFEALFTSKTEQHSEVAPASKQGSHEEHPRQAEHSIRETIAQLEEQLKGISDNPENQHKAQGAISELRKSLKKQSSLSLNEVQELDTLLAVEQKRLESLVKNDLS